MRKSMMLAAAAAAALMIAGCNYGTNEDRGATNAPSQQPNRMAERGNVPGGEAGGVAEEASDARDLVQDATKVVATMKTDPDLARLLEEAKGVFIVPEYGKAAAVVGARGGEGVLLAHGQNGTDEWTGPIFSNIGAISVGPQVGGAGGAIAMLLMNQQALDSFKQHNNFSLNADAGFTLVDYNAREQASAGKGDVILWSDMKGAFAGVSLSVTDIVINDDENDAFYAQNTTPQQILSGDVESHQADALQQALEG